MQPLLSGKEMGTANIGEPARSAIGPGHDPKDNGGEVQTGSPQLRTKIHMSIDGNRIGKGDVRFPA